MLKIKRIVKKVFFILLVLFSFLILDYNNLSLQGANATREFYTNNCSIESKQYVVTKIFDGDTILLGNGGKIRLLGIDAFEHDQNIYGIRGKDFLSMLLSSKNVCVETDVQKNDVYGRTLGYVFVDRSFINEELLKNGYAILYDFPPNIKYISRLKKAQIYARENMLGIWEGQSFILETPAQWRHKHPFKKS